MRRPAAVGDSASAPILRLCCALRAPLAAFLHRPRMSPSHLIYPWARESASTAPDVARFYAQHAGFTPPYGLVALARLGAIGLLLAARTARPARRVAVARLSRRRGQRRRRRLDALARPSLHQFGVRRGDRRAADPVRAGRNRSAFARARHRARQRRHCARCCWRARSAPSTSDL